MTPRCGNCRHFNPKGDGQGECRRFPPAQLRGEDGDTIENVWPMMLERECCGEFAPAAGAAEDAEA